MLGMEDDLMNFKDVEYKGCILKEKEIIDLFYFKFLDIPLLSRMEAVAEYFIDQVETLRDRDLADEEKEELTERFQRMRQETAIYCTAVFWNRKVIKHFHGFRLKKENFVMKMYIRYFI